MVPREALPYLGVIALGVAFVAVAVLGWQSVAGDPGLGPGLLRVALVPFFVLGALAVVVAGVDLRRELAE